MKAKKCIEFLKPYKSRPETTAVAARRLVSGALGLKSKVTKEQREAERQKLREAKGEIFLKEQTFMSLIKDVTKFRRLKFSVGG